MRRATCCALTESKIDFSIVKNTRFANGHNFQIRIEMFNATTRETSNPG